MWDERSTLIKLILIKFMRIKKYLPYLAITLLLAPIVVGAAEINTNAGWTIENVVALLDTAKDWLYAIGIALALIVIIVGGISYMTAGGNEDKQKSAKKTIITGLIGAAIILLAAVILNTLARFLGA